MTEDNFQAEHDQICHCYDVISIDTFNLLEKPYSKYSINRGMAVVALLHTHSHSHSHRQYNKLCQTITILVQDLIKYASHATHFLFSVFVAIVANNNKTQVVASTTHIDSHEVRVFKIA